MSIEVGYRHLFRLPSKIMGRDLVDATQGNVSSETGRKSETSISSATPATVAMSVGRGDGGNVADVADVGVVGMFGKCVG